MMKNFSRPLIDRSTAQTKNGIFVACARFTSAVLKPTGYPFPLFGDFDVVLTCTKKIWPCPIAVGVYQINNVVEGRGVAA